MAVFYVCWITAVETLYWRLIVLGSSNKRAGGGASFFWLGAAVIQQDDSDRSNETLETETEATRAWIGGRGRQTEATVAARRKRREILVSSWVFYLEAGIFVFGVFTRGWASCEFFVSSIWYLGLALSGDQFLFSWWVIPPCMNWLLWGSDGVDWGFAVSDMSWIFFLLLYR